MFRLIFSAISFLCLLTVGILLWQSHSLTEHLPHGAAGWVMTWFDLFENPMMAAIMLIGGFLLAVSATCVSELLLGLLLSFLSAIVSVLCLIGFLGSHYPSVAQHVEKLFH